MDAPKISEKAAELIEVLADAALDVATTRECASDHANARQYFSDAYRAISEFIATLESGLAKARGGQGDHIADASKMVNKSQDEPLPAWVTDYPPTPGKPWRSLDPENKGMGAARKTKMPFDTSQRPQFVQGRWYKLDPTPGGIGYYSGGGPNCLAEYVESEGRWYMRGKK
jgi:hypothetical protein